MGALKAVRFGDIPDVILIQPKLMFDERGSFSETFSVRNFAEIGIDVSFVQDNRSLSRNVGTIRGLHYQMPPYAQAKLVSVQCGRIYDVAVDLRRSSSTFGMHVAAELSAENGEQIFIPAGFAHGFCTLEPDTIVTYKVDRYYAPQHECGLHWQVAKLKIRWPDIANDKSVSAKDAVLPDRIDLEACFP